MSRCVFCEIVAGDTDTDIIYSDYRCIVFEPLNPVIAGHLLIVPKGHTENFATNPNLSANAVRTAAAISRPHQDYNLITSAGKAATQTVYHLHFHLIPRWEGDGLQLPWSASSRGIIERLKVRSAGGTDAK